MLLPWSSEPLGERAPSVAALLQLPWSGCTTALLCMAVGAEGCTSVALACAQHGGSVKGA